MTVTATTTRPDCLPTRTVRTTSSSVAVTSNMAAPVHAAGSSMCLVLLAPSLTMWKRSAWIGIVDEKWAYGDFPLVKIYLASENLDDDGCWALTQKPFSLLEISHLRRVPTRATYNYPTWSGRFPLDDSVGGQILNMFDKESRPTLWRVGRWLWRVSQCLHTHRCIGVRIGQLGAVMGLKLLFKIYFGLSYMGALGAGRGLNVPWQIWQSVLSHYCFIYYRC